MVFDGILNEMVEQFIILKIILVFDVGLFSMLFLRVAWGKLLISLLLLVERSDWNYNWTCFNVLEISVWIVISSLM